MVTAVITTHKRSPDIVIRAINSVISQSFKDWELLIIDDSPPDYRYRDDIKEYAIALREDYNIHYHANDSNYGVSYSRNIGIQLARGEYIAFLDDDDEWLTDKLAVQVNLICQTDINTALVYGPYYKITDGTQDNRIVKTFMKNGNLYEELIFRGNFIGGLSVPLIRKTCLESVGGFDTNMQVSEDLDLWLRLAQDYYFIYTEEPLIRYHVHGGEQLTLNTEKAIAGIERLNEKHKNYLDTHKKAKWKRQLSLVKFYLRSGRRKDAFVIWVKSARICPQFIVPNLKELARILLNWEKRR